MDLVANTPARVSFLRHSGWVGPEDLTDTVNIIGCGAVGSHIALLCAKMGFHKFQIWDADTVEPHNLANQAFDIHHVGMKKVDALTQVLQRFNPQVQVKSHDCFFKAVTDTTKLSGPLVIATDTMSSRSDIYDSFNLNPLVCGVFEVRLAFDYGECHVLDNTNINNCLYWKNTLKSDSEIPEGPCNLRICTTLVQMVSSLTVHNICARYAAQKQDIPWLYKQKTCLSLTNQLRTINPV
jgi:hypothetical protein